MEGKLTITEVIKAMDELSKPRSGRTDVLFPVPGAGNFRYQLKLFKRHRTGYRYFYYPCKGFYDRDGNLYKSLEETDERDKNAFFKS